MRDWFMLHDDGHHHHVDEDIWRHYPDTCNVHGTEEVRSSRHAWAPRETALNETRLAPSKYGFVAICYERKGRMTFFVQLNEHCAAWQRLEWPAGYVQARWDEGRSPSSDRKLPVGRRVRG
jgi:hypothetical protein